MNYSALVKFNNTNRDLATRVYFKSPALTNAVFWIGAGGAVYFGLANYNLSEAPKFHSKSLRYFCWVGTTFWLTIMPIFK